MEFITGIEEKEVLELSDLFKEGMPGKRVKVNGVLQNPKDIQHPVFSSFIAVPPAQFQSHAEDSSFL